MAEAVEKTDPAYVLDVRAEKLQVFAGKEWKRRGHTDTVAVGGGGITDRVAGRESLDVGGSLTEETRWGRTSVLAGYNTRVDGSLKVHCHQDTTLLGGGIRESHLGAEAVVAVMADDMIIGAANRTTAPLDMLVTSLIGADDVGGTVHNDVVLMEIAGVFYDREYISSTHTATGSVTWTGTLCSTQAATFKQYFKATRGLKNTVNGVVAPPPKNPPPTADGAGVLVAGAGLAQAGARAGSSTASNMDGSGQALAGVMAGDDFTEIKAAENAEDLQHVDGAARLQEVQNLSQSQNLEEMAAANNVTLGSVDPTTGENIYDLIGDGEAIYDVVKAEDVNVVPPPLPERNPVYDTVPDVFSYPTEGGDHTYAVLDGPTQIEVVPAEDYAGPLLDPDLAFDDDYAGPLLDPDLAFDDDFAGPLLDPDLAFDDDFVGPLDPTTGQQEAVYNRLDHGVDAWSTPGQQPAGLDEGVYSRLDIDPQLGGEELYQSTEGLSAVNSLDETGTVAANSDAAATVTKTTTYLEAANGDIYATVTVTPVDPNGVLQVNDVESGFNIDVVGPVNSDVVGSLDETTQAGSIEDTATGWANKASGNPDVPAPRTDASTDFGPTAATSPGDSMAAQVDEVGEAKPVSAADQRRAEAQAALDAELISQAQFDNEMALIDGDEFGEVKPVSAADQRRAEAQAALDAGQITQAQFDNEMALIDGVNFSPEGTTSRAASDGGGYTKAMPNEEWAAATRDGIYSKASDWQAMNPYERVLNPNNAADSGAYASVNDLADSGTYASVNDVADGGAANAANRAPAPLPPQGDGGGEGIYATANPQAAALRPNGEVHEATGQTIPDGREFLRLHERYRPDDWDGIFLMDVWESDQILNNNAKILIPTQAGFPEVVDIEQFADLGNGLYKFDDGYTKATLQLQFDWSALPDAEDLREWIGQRLLGVVSQSDEGIAASAVDDVVSTVAGSEDLAVVGGSTDEVAVTVSGGEDISDTTTGVENGQDLVTSGDEADALEFDEDWFAADNEYRYSSAGEVAAGTEGGNGLDDLEFVEDWFAADNDYRWTDEYGNSYELYSGGWEAAPGSENDPVLSYIRYKESQAQSISGVGGSTDEVAVTVGGGEDISDTATVVESGQDLVTSSDKADEVNALLSNTSAMKGSTDATPTPPAPVGDGGEVPVGLEQHYSSSVGGESNGLGSADMNAPGSVEVPQGEVVDAPPPANAGGEGDRIVVIEGMEAHSSTGEVQSSEIQFAAGTEGGNGLEGLELVEEADHLELAEDWIGEADHLERVEDWLGGRNVTGDLESVVGATPDLGGPAGSTAPDPDVFDVAGTFDDVVANTDELDDVSKAMTQAEGLNNPDAARNLDAVNDGFFDSMGAANGTDDLESVDDWLVGDHLESVDDWVGAADDLGVRYNLDNGRMVDDVTKLQDADDAGLGRALQAEYLKGDMALEQSYLDNLMASNAYLAGDEDALELAVFLETSGEAKQLAIDELEAGRDPAILLRNQLEQLTAAHGADDAEVAAYAEVLQLVEDPAAALSPPPRVEDVETLLDAWKLRAQEVQAGAGEQSTIERASWWSQISNKMDAAANQASVGQDPRPDLWDFARDLEVRRWRDGGSAEAESSMVFTMIKEYDSLFANLPPFKPPVA